MEDERMQNRIKMATVGALVALGLGVTAEAADVRVRCELRSGRRSKVSVDVRDVARGMYAAAISSGANQAVSPPAATIGDQVEFDFDSNRADIRQGATAIARDFIQGDTVDAEILDANGVTVATGTGACRVR